MTPESQLMGEESGQMSSWIRMDERSVATLEASAALVGSTGGDIELIIEPGARMSRDSCDIERDPRGIERDP
jgi:hypothetical protein